jgi:chemotaxis protein MotB
MAAGDKKSQIIVVKRIKKGGHGHHGGAWKIAYADFVTAMMAFFLLMWLLGSTTKGDLKGIADHFSTPLRIALSGGNGSGDSTSVIQGGGEDISRSSGQVKHGEIDSATRRALNLQAARGEILRREKAVLEELKAKVEAAIAANPRTAALSGQIRLDLTPEGLRIQIVDDQSRPMFDSGSAVVREHMRELLREIGKILNMVPNRVSLSGHTDSAPFGAGERGYSNWELSADRANASRRELITGGMDDSKVVRVVGVAAAVPLDADDPRHPTNRRISIVVMNRIAESRLLNGSELVEETGERAGQ